MFRNLARSKFEALARAVVLRKFTDEFIFRENDFGDTFYIVKEGQVDVLKGETFIRQISKNDFFGERAVLLKDARSATVYAKGPVLVWELNSTDFLAIIDEVIQN